VGFEGAFAGSTCSQSICGFRSTAQCKDKGKEKPISGEKIG
jgi:hypothetical protein